MRYTEFARTLDEDGETPISRADIVSALEELGHENSKIDGNKIHVLVQIPDGEKKNEFRKKVLNDLLIALKGKMPKSGAMYSPDKSISSLGGIIFNNSTVAVAVKDSGNQGENSAGVANEIELASIIQSVVEKYGSANVTFQDPRGKKLTIKNCTSVDIAGRDTTERKKADVVLRSERGSLPISIKELNADMWESADSLFGDKAKQIIKKLMDDGTIELETIGEKRNKRTGQSIPVYKLSKEIVVEPTPEEALNAIFGSDISPKGGVVIQTFKPQHFTQDGDNIKVDAHAIIAKKEDIPESHLMVWLIRNDSTRNNPLPGLRTLGVTLTRGIGKKGTKDVILVDVNGNVIDNPNKSVAKSPKKEKKPELEPGSEEATRTKR
jgi:hypothetical protein